MFHNPSHPTAHNDQEGPYPIQDTEGYSRIIVDFTKLSECLAGVTRVFFSVLLFSPSPPQVGESLPAVEVQEGEPKNKVSMDQLFKGKKGVLFAVPGAFTPGCSKVQYLPFDCIPYCFAMVDTVVFALLFRLTCQGLCSKLKT